MKRLLQFIFGGAMLIGVLGFLGTVNLQAQRQPASRKGPSVAWKAPAGNPSDYIGAETCSGCHRAEAQEFFKTVHAQEGKAVQPVSSAPGKAESPSVAAGRKVYNDMMCAGCHKLDGKGGTVGPAMDGIGARRTRQELMDRMLKRRAGTVMPTLPPDTSDKKINDLVDYLMTLKGGAQAEGQSAAAAGPKAVSGCEVCHGPGRAHAEAEQAAAGDPAKMEAGMKLIFKFDASPKENSERCLSCHASGKPQQSFGHSMHLATGVACQDCHSPHLVDAAENPNKKVLGSAQSNFFSVPKLPEENRWLNNSLLKEPQPALCESCHRTVQAQFALPEHHRVPEGFMKCTDCHNPHGNMNHFQLTKNAWETCVSCHVEKRGPFVYEHAVVRVDGCKACHNPHGSVNNFLLKRRAQRLLCTQCHTVVHTTPAISGWHGQANTPHGRGGYQDSGPCTRCHVAVHGSNIDEFLLR